jgi:RNA polymerase sigma factor (sigma-70 family)
VDTSSVASGAVAIAGDDEAALAACRRGEEEGLRALIERHGAMVHAVCRRRLGDRLDADDAAQAAFIIRWRRCRQVRDARRLGAWLYAVALHAAKQRARSLARRYRHEARACAAFTEEATATLTKEYQNQPRLDDALARLTERQRAAVMSRFFEQRTYAEIAAACGISEDAAKKRVAGAIVKLRSLLAPWGGSIGAAAIAADLSGLGLASRDRAVSTCWSGPPRATAYHLAREIHMHTVRRLVLSVTFAVAAALIAALTVPAQDQTPAPTPPAVDDDYVATRLYAIDDLVDNQCVWWSDIRATTGSPKPDMGPEALAVEQARSTTELTEALMRSLPATKRADALMYSVHAGSPRGDLLALLAPGRRDAEVEGMIDALRVALGYSDFRIGPCFAGGGSLAVTAAQGSHARIASVLAGAHALRMDAHRDGAAWREGVAATLMTLYQCLCQQAKAGAWPSALPEPTWAKEDAGVLSAIYFPEQALTSRDVLIAVDAGERGSFLLCASGLCLHAPEEQPAAIARHVRGMLDRHEVAPPLTPEVWSQGLSALTDARTRRVPAEEAAEPPAPPAHSGDF